MTGRWLQAPAARVRTSRVSWWRMNRVAISMWVHNPNEPSWQPVSWQSFCLNYLSCEYEWKYSIPWFRGNSLRTIWQVHQDTCGQGLVFKYVNYLEKLFFIDMRNLNCQQHHIEMPFTWFITQIFWILCTGRILCFYVILRSNFDHLHNYLSIFVCNVT